MEFLPLVVRTGPICLAGAVFDYATPCDIGRFAAHLLLP